MKPARRRWAAAAAAVGTAAAGAGAYLTCSAADALQFSFLLDQAAITSAGIFETDGRLLRTLWRGEALPAGKHARAWDGLDDLGRSVALGEHEVRLIRHSVTYRWEGVVGNSSVLEGGAQAHKSFLPPSGIAVVGDQVHYAAGYNEQQNALHGFLLAQPNANNAPLQLVDPFIAAAMIATDSTRLYWANVGGLLRTSFVGAFDLGTRQRAAWPTGQDLCLNRRTAGSCYESQDYRGVIDVQADAAWAPTGIAVQTQGRVLAVAHGAQNRIHLFDKTSGAALGSLSVPMAAKGLNQIAMAPSGDLWVVSMAGVRRYTHLDTKPALVASQTGLTQPLALAVSPTSNDGVWVADGGPSQQLKRLNRDGSIQTVFGQPGGYATDSRVADNKLCFQVRPGLEWTALAVAADESVLVVDACNNRMLRIHADARVDVPVAYLPAFYTSTVDHGNPARVFANFLEFEVDTVAPLVPGRSWRLVRNWLAGLPAQLRDADSFNAAFGGLRSVLTLRNGRTYAMLTVRNRQAIVELPANGPLRLVKFLLPVPFGNPSTSVLYENGDIGYAITSASAQAAMRLPLTGFDAGGNPRWSSEPVCIASVPLTPGSPNYRGSFSGALGPRFPLTAAGKVVFFDASAQGNEGYHLGAVAQGGSAWQWQASPTGPMDGRGAFQTFAIDGSVHYGGNAVWTHDRHIVYGYHGEGFKDLHTGKVGQANQFMHFYDNGLFVGQFGQPSTRPGSAGLSGNAFSPTLVRSGNKLYLYHNDESAHGGVHRWSIDGWQDVREMVGAGASGSTLVLR